LQNLLQWLASSVHDSHAVLSTQKLCHALVTYFIHFSQLWPNCVRHLILSLDAGYAMPIDDANNTAEIGHVASNLDLRLLRVVLWFINILVDDVGKTDASAPK
jgi:hypothetical protein